MQGPVSIVDAGLLLYENLAKYIYWKNGTMLYLQNTQEAQALFIPKNVEIPEGDLIFEAKSTIDLVTKISLQVVDLNLTTLYLQLAVILEEEVPNGEYEYTLKAGEEVVSTGLLIVGEGGKPEEIETPIEYEQYES